MCKKTTATISIAFALAVPALAQANDDSKGVIIDPPVSNSDGWEYSIAPYIWLPSLSGQAGIAGVVSDVDMATGDILEDLDIAGTFAFTAKKGKWGYFVDLEYLQLSTKDSIPAGPISQVETGFKQFRLEACVSYEIHRSEQALVDLYGGLQYTYNHLDIDFENRGGGKLGESGSEEWLDPVIGVKMRYDLNEKWFLNLVGEVGGFGVSSDLTWQAMAGVGYNINDCWALIAGYRHLYIDYENGDFLYDLDTSGIMIGGVYNF